MVDGDLWYLMVASKVRIERRYRCSMLLLLLDDVVGLDSSWREDLQLSMDLVSTDRRHTSCKILRVPPLSEKFFMSQRAGREEHTYRRTDRCDCQQVVNCAAADIYVGCCDTIYSRVWSTPLLLLTFQPFHKQVQHHHGTSTGTTICYGRRRSGGRSSSNPLSRSWVYLELDGKSATSKQSQRQW